MKIAEIVLAFALFIVTGGLVCFSRNQWRSIKEQNWIMGQQHELEKRRHSLSKLAFYTEHPPKTEIGKVRDSGAWLSNFKEGITTVLDLEEAADSRPQIDVWVYNTGRTEGSVFEQRAKLVYYRPQDMALRFGILQEPEDAEVGGGKRYVMRFVGDKEWKPENRQVNMPVTKIVLVLYIHYTDKLDREYVLAGRFDYNPKDRRFGLTRKLPYSDNYEYED